jgi:C1A family cysteine protease
MTKYGYIKDSYDARDYQFTAAAKAPIVFAPVDLRPKCSPVMDQGKIGSCTAFGTTSMVQFVRSKQNLQNFTPSPLFTYYTTRQIEGTESRDAGAMVRNALKSAVVYGVVQEEKWRYDVTKFKLAPTPDVYAEAQKYQKLEYRRITDGVIHDMQQCLFEGYPFTFGAMLFKGFESSSAKRTGIVPMPSAREARLGGHCMLCVGWKMINSRRYFIIQNSWGTNWGSKGFCYIPFEYMGNKNLVNDCWTIRLTEV